MREENLIRKRNLLLTICNWPVDLTLSVASIEHPVVPQRALHD